MTKFTRLFAFILILMGIVYGQDLPQKEVYDSSIQPGDSVIWYPDTVYVLKEFVFVDSLAVLRILPGTVIKGEEGQAENAKALIVARGGRIYAEGTRENPIIFTSVYDDVTDPLDMLPSDRGLWGGVIILGRAVNNVPGGSEIIEGLPSTETRAYHGGNDDHDFSGILRYVSIRHGGSIIGANNEINGLTLGSVGDRTIIEYIEVYNNADDGFEFFGGTVTTRYLVSALNDDDAFDYDLGFRGKGQFWFAYMDNTTGDRGGEFDGGPSSAVTAQPYTRPIISNMTFIGSGASSINTDNDHMVILRENAGSWFLNSIFYDGYNKAFDFNDSYELDRLRSGDILFRNNVIYSMGLKTNTDQTNLTIGDVISVFDPAYLAEFADSLTRNGNVFADPLLVNLNSNRRATGDLDPRPDAQGPAGTGTWFPSDPFFEPVDYKGAFAPGQPLWIDGWTFISAAGYVTGLENKNQAQVIRGFRLEQNYPNPFNPITTINYAIDAPATVRLAVYNALGQKVATLVNAEQNPGEYHIQWEASNMPGGIYYYTLSVDGRSVTRKMVLMK